MVPRNLKTANPLVNRRSCPDIVGNVQDEHRDLVCLIDHWATVVCVWSGSDCGSCGVINGDCGDGIDCVVDSECGEGAVWGRLEGRPAHPLLTPFLLTEHTKTPLAAGELEAADKKRREGEVRERRVRKGRWPRRQMTEQVETGQSSSSRSSSRPISGRPTNRIRPAAYFLQPP